MSEVTFVDFFMVTEPVFTLSHKQIPAQIWKHLFAHGKFINFTTREMKMFVCKENFLAA